MFGVDSYLAKVKEGLESRVPEQVLAFGLFTPHGSAAMLVSPLASMIQKRGTRKAAGGRKLPKSVALAITPTSIYAFGVKSTGYRGHGRIEDEVGRWPRAGTRFEAGAGSLLDRFTAHFADGTRLELEAMNMMGMRKINEEFLRAASEPV